MLEVRLFKMSSRVFKKKSIFNVSKRKREFFSSKSSLKSVNSVGIKEESVDFQSLQMNNERRLEILSFERSIIDRSLRLTLKIKFRKTAFEYSTNRKTAVARAKRYREYALIVFQYSTSELITHSAINFETATIFKIKKNDTKAVNYHVRKLRNTNAFKSSNDADQKLAIEREKERVMKQRWKQEISDKTSKQFF